MTRQNFYEEFANIYDELMEDTDYEKWSDFIIKRVGSQNGKLLEAACGTGSITQILAEKNINITAFDSSDEMLIKAYEKLRKNKNVTIINQDMVNFSINEKFGACICCCDGVNYLNTEDVEKFFKKVYDHISNGGMFLFDISTVYKYNMMDGTYVYENDDIFYVWENSLNDDENSISMEINFFVKVNGTEKYERITEMQTHFMHTSEKILKILENVGFEDVGVYDDYSDVALKQDSIRATFLCYKK